jgi:hypothetical protein
VIKGRGTRTDGGQVVVLGLSGENMTRLMADEPIVLNLKDMGLADIEVIILGGRTEEAMVVHLEKIGLLPPGIAEGMPR